MVNPAIMCRQHLLGEHLELHMFVGAINKGLNLKGYIDGNLFEPLSIQKRHAALVKEMSRRGYSHNSPLPFYVHTNLYGLTNKVNANKSLLDLMERCSECRERFTACTGDWT